MFVGYLRMSNGAYQAAQECRSRKSALATHRGIGSSLYVAHTSKPFLQLALATQTAQEVVSKPPEQPILGIFTRFLAIRRLLRRLCRGFGLRLARLREPLAGLLLRPR